MSKTMYVASQAKSAHCLLGKHPDVAPGETMRFYENIEDARQSLTETPSPTSPIGPGVGERANEAISLPQASFVFEVELTEHEYNRIMENNGRGYLNPNTITQYWGTVEPDMLHASRLQFRCAREPEQSLDYKSIDNAIYTRGQDMQQLANCLARTPNETALPDFTDPVVQASLYEAYSPDGFVRGSSEGMDNASRALQKIEREMSDKCDISVVAQMGNIHAMFNARLEAQPANVFEADRIALAMTQTISAISASVSPAQATVLSNISEHVRGVVDEVSKEAELEDYKDINSDDGKFSDIAEDMPDIRE